MMKKVLYGVALTLFAGVSVGSLQSCKDDVNDLRTQTSYDLTKLKSQLAAESARLEGLINQNASDIASIRRDYATIQYVDGLVAGLQAVDQQLADKIDGAVSRLDGRIDALTTEVNDQKAYLEGLIQAQQAEIDALKALLEVDPETGKSVRLDNIENEINELWNALNGPGGIQEQLSQILNYAMDIEKKLDKVVERMDGLVTGILIQRVKSPVFGDFSLPIGVQSNMLFNWFGFNDRGQDVKFPDGKGQFSANGEVDFNVNSLGWNTNGKDLLVVPDGYYADELSLGKVYVTLNPIGHVFNNTELTLVNSKGEALPFTVALEPSEELLTYGYTREGSTIESGLYEGEVKLNLSNDPDENGALSSIRMSLDDKLVSAMKDAVKDPTKRNAAHLLKTLYDSMSGKLPAYGLRYDWSIEDGDEYFSPSAYAVLSQYDLAVAAARPLGFNFLADVTGTGKVPTISNIDNFIAELVNKNLQNLDIKGDDITVLGHKVGFTGALDFDTNESNELVATISGVTVDGETLPDIVKVCDSPESASDNISDAIAEAVIDKIGATSEADKAAVKASINIALLQLQKQINDVLENVNGQIKDTFEGMANSADSYIDKVNRAVDLYNKVADKINNFLTNPNHYLQAAAFYEAGNDMGILSGDVKNPTVFTQAGGNAFSVFLSSYTGELIVPAYKKFVACTGVYQNGVKTQDKFGDVNKSSDKLNEILDGSEIRVVVPTSNLEAGKVYEFTYQALDYRGFTSTKKFYIEVK